MGTFRAKILEETWSSKRHLDVDQRDFAQMDFLSTLIAQVANSADQYSLVSIQLLEWIRHTVDPDIQYTLRYGEKKLGIFRLDGYSPWTRTAYEF